MAAQIGKRRVCRRKAAPRTLGQHAQCPLWVISGRLAREIGMSALPLKADMLTTNIAGIAKLMINGHNDTNGHNDQCRSVRFPRCFSVECSTPRSLEELYSPRYRA